MECADHPVQYYVLTLQDITSVNQTVGLSESKEPAFSITSLEENSRYAYGVRAVNNVNVSSDEVQGGVFCK